MCFSFLSVHRLRDGQEVDLNSSRIVGGNLDAVSIRIRNATRHDRGAYTCRLENDVGPADSTNEVYVDIYCKQILFKLFFEKLK